jgi:hypothetical protein
MTQPAMRSVARSRASPAKRANPLGSINPGASS